MKLRLMALLLLALPFAAPGAGLDSPSSITLSVDAGQAGLLTWEPIDRDDLMGYSVWMRQGSGDFTRLNIPTMVGKEMKKLPMTTKASLTLKGIGKRDLELEVVAEYEGGRSKPGPSVFSRKARRLAATPAPEAPGPASGAPAALSPLAGAEAPAVPREDSKAEEAPLRPKNAWYSMAPFGKIQTAVALHFAYEETTGQGNGSLNSIGFTVTDGTDRNIVQNWSVTYMERVIDVPLSVRYGLLSALEISAETAWRNERDSQGDFKFGDKVYHNISGSDTLDGSAFTDTWVGAKVRPSQSQPLFLSGAYSFATGKSRFAARSRSRQGISSDAGSDEGVSRLRLALDFGEKEIVEGLSYHAQYSPGATESLYLPGAASSTLLFQADHGQELQLGAAYTFPWSVSEQLGAASLGVSLISREPGRYLINGVDQRPIISKAAYARFRGYTGINLEREDQLQLSLGFRQNLYNTADRHGAFLGGVDAGGSVSYSLKPDGWVFNASGGFYY